MLVSQSKICDDCGNVSICKYKEDLDEFVKSESAKIKVVRAELPLHVNFLCEQWRTNIEHRIPGREV